MSWQRRQQEIQRRSYKPHHKGYQASQIEPFPVIRPVKSSIERQLTTVIYTVIDNLGGSEVLGVSEPQNKYRVNRSSVCLMGVSEMKRYQDTYWPEDPEIFLDELAHKTKTTNRSLSVIASDIGLFGSNRKTIKTIGLTFDEESTEILKEERMATTGLIKPGSEGLYANFYPHVSIGQWAVSMEVLKSLKPVILEHIQNLGEIALQPVTAKYISSNKYIY